MVDHLEPWAQFGLAGICLGWFMFRLERVLTRQADRLQEMGDAVLLVVMGSEAMPQGIRREAERRLGGRGKKVADAG